MDYYIEIIIILMMMMFKMNILINIVCEIKTRHPIHTQHTNINLIIIILFKFQY